MYPELRLAKIMNTGNLKLSAVFGYEVLDLPIIIFNDLVKALGHNCSAVYYSRDLSSQEVFLSAEEERVSKYGSLEVAAQEDLDLAGSADVRGGQVGQLGPLLED